MNLLPPRPVLVLALRLVVPVVVAAGLVGYVAGGLAALGLILGVVAGVQAALLSVPLAARVAVVVLAACAAGLGSVADTPASAAMVVGLTAVAQAPLTRVAAGLGALLVVVPGVTATVPLPDEPWTLAGWTAAGVLLVIAIARGAGLAAPADPVGPRDAWTHGAALALLAGAAAYVVVDRGLVHGYWLVLTVAQVLQPAALETPRVAVHRIGGTFLGAAIGVAAVVTLPTAVCLGLAALFLVAMAGWALAADTVRQVVYATALVVLVGSAGVAGPEASLALEKVVVTLVGAGGAVLVALLLSRLTTDREGARRTTPRSATD